MSKSLFDKLKYTSTNLKNIEESLDKERKALFETLSPQDISNLFQNTALGTTSNGQQIKPEDVANQANASQIATTPDGAQVLVDPVTKQVTVVAKDPSQVKIASNADIEKLNQLALQTRQAQSINQTPGNNQPNQPTQVNKQDSANAQNASNQQTKQNQQQVATETVNVYDALACLEDIMKRTNNPGQVIDEEEDDKGERTAVVEVEPAEDTLIEPVDETDPGDALSFLGNLWSPSYMKSGDDNGASMLKQAVTKTQEDLTGIMGPLVHLDKPKARPNMSQYVKTGNQLRSPGGSSKTDAPFDVNDLGSVIGMDSPISIKLAVSIN